MSIYEPTGIPETETEYLQRQRAYDLEQAHEEIERLHKVTQNRERYEVKMRAERDNLLSVNKQLLEALEEIAAAADEPFNLHVGYDGGGNYIYTPALKLDDDTMKIVRTAIQAAKASS